MEPADVASRIWRAVALDTIVLLVGGFALVLVRRRWPLLPVRVGTDLAILGGLVFSDFLVNALVEFRNPPGVDHVWIDLGAIHTAGPWLVAIIAGIAFSRLLDRRERHRATDAA